MRYTGMLALAGLLALAFFIIDNNLYGQRGGRGGGGGGGFHGGSVSRGGGGAVGPYGGSGSGSRSSGTVVGPTGRTTTGGSGSGSYTTNRGSTINYAGAGAKTTGPGGATAGRGVGGVQVTTPGGQTATKAGTAGGVAGPGGNAAVRGGSVTTASGARGSATSVSHGAAAMGPGGAAAGRSQVGVATGAGGGVAVGGSRTGVATGPYGAAAYSSRGVAVGGNRTNYVSSSALRTQGVYVRQNFGHYDCFNQNWYRGHPGAWYAAGWTASNFWRWTPWTTVSGFCGYPVTPVVYDYGTTLVYADNNVYYNGDPIASAQDYAAQATQIAAVGQVAKPADTDEWTPLGVFGMVQGEEKDANNLFQLAINKTGVIRGNYYNALTDSSVPVYGSVDPKTQRAAWTVGDRKDTVYETGIGNLTEPTTTMLVHFGKDRTQQWNLVRLDPPKE